MSLIECRHCFKKISIESKTCIHCGCPKPYEKPPKPYVHPSIKIRNFFDSLDYFVIDFCGWVFLVCALFFMTYVNKPWGMENQIYFSIIGALCGSVYLSHKFYIKRFWYIKEKKIYDDYTQGKYLPGFKGLQHYIFYLLLYVVFFVIVFFLLLYFFIEIREFFHR